MKACHIITQLAPHNDDNRNNHHFTFHTKHQVFILPNFHAAIG